MIALKYPHSGNTAICDKPLEADAIWLCNARNQISPGVSDKRAARIISLTC